MAVVYKWGITNTKYAYLYNPNKEGSIKGPDIVIGEDKLKKIDDNQVSKIVQAYSEEEYKNSYNELVNLMSNSTDNDIKSVQMLDYLYYWNIDNSECGLVEYGYKGKDGENGVGIVDIKQEKNGLTNTITFVLSNGKEYDIFIKDGEQGAVGPIGPIGETGEKGDKGDKGDAINISDDDVLYIQEKILENINPKIENISNNITNLSGSVSSEIKNIKNDILVLSGITVSTTEKINSIENDVETIKKNIDDTQKALDSKADNGKYNDLIINLGNLQKQLDDNTLDIGNSNTIINNMYNRVDSFENDLYSVNTTLQDYRTFVSSIKLKTDTNESNLNNLQTQYNNTKSDVDSQLKNITNRVSTIEKDNTIDGITSNIDELQTVNNAFNNTINSINSKLTNVENGGNDNSTKIKNIEKQYENIVNNENYISNNISVISLEISEIQNYISLFKEQISGLTDSLNKIQNTDTNE